MPDEQQRSAADAFLRSEVIEGPLGERLERVAANFGWAEEQYIAEARRQGDASRVWETTCWIIANALARESAAGPG